MQEHIVPDRAPYGGSPNPLSLKKQLEDLDKKVADFEAEQIEQRRAALKELTGAGDQALAAYPFAELRKRWCAQQQTIEGLQRQIASAFPTPWRSWERDLIPNCICPPLKEVRDKKERLREQELLQSKAGKGNAEQAVDAAKAVVATADGRVRDLLANAANVETVLTTNLGLIEAVLALLKSDDPATALYPFWFQLVPAHQQLRPDDVDDSCIRFATPEKLCDPESRTPREPSPPPPHALPWLMTPNKFWDELRDAFGVSEAAAADLATKEAAFQAEITTAEATAKALSDKIEALRQDLEQTQTALEGKIDECLKKATPEGTCCTRQAADRTE